MSQIDMQRQAQRMYMKYVTAATSMGLYGAHRESINFDFYNYGRPFLGQSSHSSSILAPTASMFQIGMQHQTPKNGKYGTAAMTPGQNGPAKVNIFRYSPTRIIHFRGNSTARPPFIFGTDATPVSTNHIGRQQQANPTLRKYETAATPPGRDGPTRVGRFRFLRLMSAISR